MRRPSPALIVAIIALVFAMGGTGYAVSQLPRSSVGTQQLKRDAVTSPKIKDGAIAAADLSAAARAALTGQKGDPGPSGVTGMAAVRYSGLGRNLDIFVTDVLALQPASASGDRRSTGGITVTRDSRLVMTYAITLEQFTGGAAPTAMCGLYLGDEAVTDAANGIGNLNLTTMQGIGQVPLMGTGSITVPAGTHDVSVRCATMPAATPTAQVVFRYGTLTVIAAAA